MVLDFDDIQDYRVRDWYRRKVTGKDICYYLGTPGLGEMILQTPVLQSLHDAGEKVILIVREAIASAFEDAPFLKSIINCGPNDLTYTYNPIDSVDTVQLSDNIIEQIQGSADYLLTPCVFNGPNVLRVFDFRRRNRSYRPRDISRMENYAFVTDVYLTTRTLWVGHDTVCLEPTSKTKVGFCIGSHEPYRRLTDRSFTRLTNALKNRFELYLYGLRFTEGIEGVISLMNTPLRKQLGFLKEMDVFVTPDTGMLHAAVALQVPTVVLESREMARGLLVQESHCHNIKVLRSDTLSCERNCNAQLGLKWRGNGYPYTLSCLDYVDCLNNIQASEIIQAVEEFIK